LTLRIARERLEDILEAANDLIEFVGGLDENAADLLPSSDRRTYRAMKNAFSEIGEAIKRLPPDLLARHPDVDWRGWARLRDVVAHSYDRLRPADLRKTVLEEAPQLIAAITDELARNP
jgi:uncharacterized protein with HEPN domain